MDKIVINSEHHTLKNLTGNNYFFKKVTSRFTNSTVKKVLPVYLLIDS